MVGDDEIPSDGGGAGASTVLLDSEAIRSLNDLVGDDPEIIAELVDAFLEEAPIASASCRPVCARPTPS